MHNDAEHKFSEYRDINVVQKAERFANFTVASLMSDPTRQADNADTLQRDFQSTGALLVNNLTAKLGTALFPAGRPSFKINIDEATLSAAIESGADEAAVRTGAAELERLATTQLFKNASLSRLHRALSLAVVTGNALLYRDAARQRFLVWNLHSYVLRRDAFGDIDEIILKQKVRFGNLPTDVQEHYRAQKSTPPKPEDNVDLYTEIVYDRKDVPIAVITQSIDGASVGEPSVYPEHLCPYIAIAWNVPIGEHYGRGYVEDYAGDFTKFSLMAEQLALYELESLDLLNLVDESAGGAIDDYQNANLGDYVPGRVGAITAYERGDYNKIAAIRNGQEAVEMRLSRAFMYTGQQRDAERVTAEEVRTLASEAETLLGGAYSVLAETVQAPLAYLCMYEVAKESESAELTYEIISKALRPQIVTGIPALTQASETQNLMRATEEAAAVVPALAEISQRFDTEKVIEMIFNNNSVPLERLSKSVEQLQEEAEMQQMQEQMLAQQQQDVTNIQGEQ